MDTQRAYAAAAGNIAALAVLAHAARYPSQEGHVRAKAWPRDALAERDHFSRWVYPEDQGEAELTAVTIAAHLEVEDAVDRDCVDPHQDLAGPRLRTRSRYAETTAASLVDARFGLLPSFAAPHYSVVLPAYDEAHVRHLLEVLGEAKRNPHLVGRQQ